MNRREFVTMPATLMAAATLLRAESEIPWQRKVRRLGQWNMTEHDRLP